jgi:hypothetical protein
MTLCLAALRCLITAPMGGTRGRPATPPYGGRTAADAGA